MTTALEVVSSTPRPQFTPGKDPVPILQEAGWAPGPVWTGGKSPPHRDSIPERPARSQSLYRLSYPAHDGTSNRWKLLMVSYDAIFNKYVDEGRHPNTMQVCSSAHIRSTYVRLTLHFHSRCLHALSLSLSLYCNICSVRLKALPRLKYRHRDGS